MARPGCGPEHGRSDATTPCRISPGEAEDRRRRRRTALGSGHAIRGEGRRRPQQGRSGQHRDDPRARSRARARRSSTCRRAGSATPTCTTARAASTTTSRSCSATRRPGVVDRGRRGRHQRGRRRLRDPQLAGGLRAVPRLPARASRWYCFNTHNAAQKMTLADGTELSPALGIGAFVEKTLVALRAVHQGRPGRPADRGRPARLRRDGRHRRGDQHRRRAAAATRVAVFGCGGVGDAAIAGARAGRRDARSSPSTSTTGSSSGPRTSAPPTRSTRRRPTRSRRSGR